MIAFDVGSFRNARAFLNGVRLMTLAESLGGVESLVGHPASMTHASLSRETREKAGITDDLIRLAVGCEDARDLIEDLRAALDSLARAELEEVGSVVTR